LTPKDSQGGTPREEQTMAALLEEEKVYPELRRGEIIEGVVVGTDRDGILVDIGAKSEGVVPPQEMHCLQPEGSARLNPGDKVLVFVLQPESPEGQIILSLDRARGERGWRVLQEYMESGESFEGYVTGSNKGGLLVNVEGVNAFVPLSQIVGGPERATPELTQKALSEWVGRSLTLKVIELNRRRNRAILSERAAVQEKRAAEKERLLQELQEGDIRTGRITSIRDFGVFVDIGGADGLVHLSELSWERTPKSPHELFKVGDELPVYVLKIDNESKKIALSVRRAQPERWEEIVARYREGQIVPGQVTKLAPFGAFVRLEGPIEGLIHISELVDRRINHPKEVVNEGDVVPVKIVRIEHDRHRLGLSLRQAREKAEEEGWVFHDLGGVLSAPPQALEALGLTEMPAAQQEAAAEAAMAAASAPADEKDSGSTQPSAEAEAPSRDEAEPQTAIAAAVNYAQQKLGEAEAAAEEPVEFEASEEELEAVDPEAATQEPETAVEEASEAEIAEDAVSEGEDETKDEAGVRSVALATQEQPQAAEQAETLTNAEEAAAASDVTEEPPDALNKSEAS
jgi:small subunit ribosomal protein S1